MSLVFFFFFCVHLYNVYGARNIVNVRMRRQKKTAWWIIETIYFLFFCIATHIFYHLIKTSACRMLLCVSIIAEVKKKYQNNTSNLPTPNISLTLTYHMVVRTVIIMKKVKRSFKHKQQHHFIMYSVFGRSQYTSGTRFAWSVQFRVRAFMPRLESEDAVHFCCHCSSNNRKT